MELGTRTPWKWFGWKTESVGPKCYMRDDVKLALSGDANTVVARRQELHRKRVQRQLVGSFVVTLDKIPYIVGAEVTEEIVKIIHQVYSTWMCLGTSSRARKSITCERYVHVQ